MDALDVACAGSAPVSLAPDGLGKFGRPADATLWLGVAPTRPFRPWPNVFAKNSPPATFPSTRSPFRPHITLGRRVRIPKKPLPPLAFPLPAHARTVTLFKSTLSREGAEYKPLYTVELGEPAEMPTSTPN